MLCRDIIEGLSRQIFAAGSEIARLSTIRTTQFVTTLREADAAVGADVVGDPGEILVGGSY